MNTEHTLQDTIWNVDKLLVAKFIYMKFVNC